jgi:hypothetical protein
VLLVGFILLSGMVSTLAQPREALPPRVPITPETAAAITHYMQRPLRADRVLWSPGGSVLAVIDSTDILLFNASDWLAEPLQIRLDQAIADVGFSADGLLILTASPGAIIGWNVTDGTQSLRLNLDASRIALSPDNLALAAITRRGAIEIWNMQERTGYVLAEPTGGAVGRDLTFTPDGGALLVESNGQVNELNLIFRDSQPMAQVVGAATIARGLAVTADGRHIVVATDGPFALSALNLRSDAEATEFALPAEYQRVNGWAVNTRAGLVVAAGVASVPEQSALLVWSLASGGEPLARLRHAGVRDSAPNRDGSLIASVGGGTLRLWALEASLPTAEQARLLSDVNVVAACDSVGAAPIPGSIVGGQRLSLVWSWYAQTQDQVRAYLDAAIFQVELDGQSPRVWLFFTQTKVDAVNDDLPTVYVFAPVGVLPSGSHQAGVEVTWTRPISDGFDEYGPGTNFTSDGGSCRFAAN